MIAFNIISKEHSTIVYPAPESPNDVRYNDLIELLHSILERTVEQFGSYSLKPSIRIPESRLFKELERNIEINLVWSSTSIKKEEKFLPIRIPLRNDILGYRICIINQYKQSLIDQVETLDDLKKLTIGQGLGWGDVQLYKQNGVNVITAFYPNLFEMVASGCFDLFPRGLAEATHELNHYRLEYPDLVIEKNMVIYYPWPYYFFVRKQDTRLAKRIERGLQDMISDGSLNTLFLKYNAALIQESNLKQRRVIKINNPLLPSSPPSEGTSLWDSF